ncbi:MAG: class I SAM-dependent methyltransferase [Bacteroidota bacterium]
MVAPPTPASAFWDARFAAPDYAYGTEPNAWLSRQVDRLPSSGTALVPAAGEGRDAVWLAEQGFTVTAVDLSREGLRKARSLAEARGVSIETIHADLSTWNWPKASVDVVVLSFVHVAPSFRPRLHRAALTALRPGGLLVLEGFHVGQLVHRAISGGPPRAEMLFTADLLRDDLRAAEILALEETETTLREGAFHDGLAHVVHGLFRRR